jgi:Peptidase family M48
VRKPASIRYALAAGAVVALALSARPAAADEGTGAAKVIDAAIANEQRLATALEKYRPMVEAYIQTVKPDPTEGTIPVRDSYFFGRLALADPGGQASDTSSRKKKSLSLLEDFHSSVFKPEDFARMLILDRGSFDRETYDFSFIRAEFLGDVRTLVFDVTPKAGKPNRRYRPGRFLGRIWIEDRGFAIVRYNGIYASDLASNFHFDSWRMNLADGLWLPAYVYTEEADRSSRQLSLTHRGQIRVWGYDPSHADAADEFTKVLIDAPRAKDQSESGGSISPVESARAWESEAEENVVRRLERADLLAPRGRLDQVLETVVNNLEVTNDLNIDPPVRCRVLLTTPLESFTVGRTIVVSRGLIDVLPDEASLAMVLAHELGHVLSGHTLDTRYAFTDRVLVPDRDAVQQFQFERVPAEEAEADAKAIELLAKSPYKDKLAGAGLFLKELTERAEALHALVRPHFGSQQPYRMAQIVEAAPALDPASLTQIAALPLGSRVRVDPWSASVELMPQSRVPLVSAREKLALQVTPLMPYLTRFGAAPAPAGDEPAAADAKPPAADVAARRAEDVARSEVEIPAKQ